MIDRPESDLVFQDVISEKECRREQVETRGCIFASGSRFASILG